MQRENYFLLGSLALFSFCLSYFLSEVFPTPLWWYYPLDQHWEYGVLTTPGLRMGWYGKVLFSFEVSLAISTLSFCLVKLTRRQTSASLLQGLNLAAMSITVFILYYFARTLIARM
ncbi:hypothetical protein COW36_10455 [bacterium (Candidatus Blackallbacteria) CG17_big_fil_post_rev_8_21_14_2_50_48_46]|uniref:Uncharacterized protein n=1 Tax=bacterium (Candidatus Blackallbacteria) CG17_big_fil_post_rev_8_21_14_2_50_48_46 TaxID=2014261 RepID=A0A2M7G541_9BACT|nr:MAG: hypothetical protein COW64_20230 [bacterium (Candidatus Blackallbacteria) CG18_big_fil_WC_8_21_14_2_50_49_26]PIW17053.1 MAG: hypothetical protein COW36_10455 [bacterium (Candidatus Blackallbacteria) CG17_big_fil_post_rev_8_21_14_2_50_48_46]PIW47712.1 MAG: hypothetical protein COW20_11765 [bacterium (Candidatus Blackallbacteria) CG13_big_fil_rev_8_21_14_2_50_49_14]